MTVTPTASVATTPIGSAKDNPSDADKAKTLQDELKKFEAELNELSKPSPIAPDGPAKPKGPTSGLIDESV